MLLLETAKKGFCFEQKMHDRKGVARKQSYRNSNITSTPSTFTADSAT